MTGTVAMGVLSLTVPPRSGDHSGKGADADGKAFDDALAVDLKKQPAGDKRDGERPSALRPIWKLGSLGAAFAKDAPTEPDGPGKPDGDVADAETVAEGPQMAEAALKPETPGTQSNGGDALKTLAERTDASGRGMAPAAVEAGADRGLAETTKRGVVPAIAGDAETQARKAAGAGTGTIAGEPSDGKSHASGERQAAATGAQSAPRTLGAMQAAIEPARPTAPQPPAAQAPVGPAQTERASDEGDVPLAKPAMVASTDAPARVGVVGTQNMPAPAPVSAQILGPTAAGLVSAIGRDPAWLSIASDHANASSQRGAASSAGVSTLRIQLQPAELGMVTARLTAAGEQLSIEIQVESNDARHRLTSDSDAIVKALRSLGYDIDKLTIQQSSNSNGAGQQGSFGRDAPSPNAQHQGEGAGRGQSERSASGRENEGARHGPAEKPADHSGGGVYI